MKRFEKDYRGKQWDITVESIFQDLVRIKTSDSDLQRTQQVDELWHKASCWIFKYDFRVAQTKESTKSSGNRCVAFLDNVANKIKILVIFGKSDLPKNIGEQAFSSCINLVNVTILSETVNIHDGAFYASESIRNVIISEKNNIDKRIFPKDTIITYK